MDEQTHTLTDNQTPLTTSTVVCYATPVGNILQNDSLYTLPFINLNWKLSTMTPALETNRAGTENCVSFSKLFQEKITYF